MRTRILPTLVLTVLGQLFGRAQTAESPIRQSYYKLTTSNGLIAAVYDTRKNVVEYVVPHIFALYDSASYVRPFVGNIALNSSEMRPTETRYLENTHVISVKYAGFTVYYFASFTNDSKVFYAVIRGEKPKVEDLSFRFESGDGKVLTGISLLTSSHTDLSVHLGGIVLSGTAIRRFGRNLVERYFLYSFTDSLHHDTSVISEAIARLRSAKASLVDDEVRWMKRLHSRCRIPKSLSATETTVLEQSISFLKMAQVSQSEIFPYSRGQILASLRPGLWHAAWVRDGSYAIQAMTHLGMYEEAKKGLEFMLKAPPGNYQHYIWKDGKDYGIGADYQISVCRYYGTGKEESTQYGDGPNIEIDNFGLFLSAYSDYIRTSHDSAFGKKWNRLVKTKVADATIGCIDTNSLIKRDSGPWEHYLQMTKQYTFTSGVCARGLELFAGVQKLLGVPYQRYQAAAETLRRGLAQHMFCDNRYFRGNSNDQSKTDHEYYDSGAFEIFANGLIGDKKAFLSHMAEYDTVLRIPGKRPGYIRLRSTDPYENQEWVFINLRIALAHLLFGQRTAAAELLDHVTNQAAANYNTIPEMFSNKAQLDKVTDEFKSNDVWCNCMRDKGDQYIGAIPMIGYGSGAYILTLLAFHTK